jgi:glyoxylase-like metal-dependent hydrolase (beta-lactamase superfamily II)
LTADPGPEAPRVTATILPVTDAWFASASLDHAIARLWEPHVHSFLRCNIWLVHGRDRDALIDTGLGIARLREAFPGLFARPTIAIATHAHYDHIGGLDEFDERWAHELDAPPIEDTDSVNRWATLYASGLGIAVQPYEDAGVGMPELLIDAAPHAGFDPAAYRVRPSSITRRLADGDIIDLGDRQLEALHLPGHSPGSIGLWEAVTGTLFSGDAIYDGPLLDELPGSDIPAYVRTMERLRALPVTTVHGGHDQSFGRERFLEIIDEYISRRRST